jgi:hypothetical protein
MSTEQITTIAVSIIQSGAIIYFLWFYIRGLKREITSLHKTVEIQNATLGVMDRRIQETEKVGDIYRKLLNDLPADMEKYRSVIASVKDQTIKELELAVQNKDDKLKRMAEINLKELEIQEQLIAELPKLKLEMTDNISVLKQAIAKIGAYLPELTSSRHLDPSQNIQVNSFASKYFISQSSFKTQVMLHRNDSFLSYLITKDGLVDTSNLPNTEDESVTPDSE